MRVRAAGRAAEWRRAKGVGTPSQGAGVGEAAAVGEARLNELVHFNPNPNPTPTPNPNLDELVHQSGELCAVERVRLGRYREI